MSSRKRAKYAAHGRIAESAEKCRHNARQLPPALSLMMFAQQVSPCRCRLLLSRKAEGRQRATTLRRPLSYASQAACR